MNMLLMGPQGAGKGTVADILKNYFKVPHISMGDLLRDTLNTDSAIAIEIKAYMDKGALVPLEVIQKMLKDRLNMVDCQNGFILDGFPRDKEQADVLDEITKIDYVIVLEVSKEVSLFRLGNRVQCKNCGHIFNIATLPSKVEGICDICQGELYQRADDKPEAIEKRLSIYEKETKPLMERYKDIILRIDTSTENPENIAQTIISSIKK